MNLSETCSKKKICYKSCFVPLCERNFKKNPDKVFIFMSKDEKLRKTWFKVAHRKDLPNLNTNYYCCEDHFDLENDLENFIKFKMYGGPFVLKEGVVPHKFHCQPNRVSTSSVLNRTAFKKINRKRDIQEIFNESSSEISEIQENISPNKNAISSQSNMVENENLNGQSSLCQLQNIIVASNSQNVVETSTKTSVSTSFENKPLEFGEGPSLEEIFNNKDLRLVTKKSRKKIVHFRSKAIMCKPYTCDFSCSAQPNMVDKGCMPKSPCYSEKSFVSSENKLSTTPSATSNEKCSSNSFKPSSSGSTSSFSDGKASTDSFKKTSLKVTKYFILKQPKEYIGISQMCIWIIDLLKVKTGISEDKIMLTLMKIKKNDSFCILSNQFGISTSKACTIFNNSVEILSHFLKELIIIPTVNEVKNHLPIPFRAFYNNVYTIIDAFEIEIKKPRNPVHQALSWSEYKKCNTVKYLIACTPDGLINFISKGFGGRINDTTLFEESGFMDSLTENVAVMADRGFKHIEKALHGKHCKLIRPPSVSDSVKPTKEKVLESKRIASLRIHIERVIRRVREYRILEPHSCLNLSFLKIIDNIVLIVCALINLQSPIIKM